MKDKRMLIIGGLVLVLLIAIPLTVYIANQQQDVRSNAAVGDTLADVNVTVTSAPTATNAPTSTPLITLTNAPTVTAAVTPTTLTPTPTGSTGGACTAPATVTSVILDYPSCQGTQCNFTQASCTWAAVNGATSYSVTITQVESGTVTKTDTVTAPAVTYSFPVEQGKTYRCDISAVNSCGTAGTAGSAQALCEVDGQVGAPAPTQAPQAPPPAQVIPTVMPTGDVNTTMIIGIGGVAITIVGGLLFLFSGI